MPRRIDNDALKRYRRAARKVGLTPREILAATRLLAKESLANQRRAADKAEEVVHGHGRPLRETA